MLGHVEVDYEKELEAIVRERQAGADKFGHVTTIAQAVASERLRMTNFLEAQGGHGKKLNEIDRKVDGLDRKVDGLDRKVDGLDRKVDGLDRKVDGLERKVDGLEREMRQGFAAVDRRFEAVDQRFDTMERRIVAQMETFTDRVLKGVAAQLEAHKVPAGEVERRGYRS
jgi:predicted RNase H-like nuclease (RuvC/YqgF family)